MIISGNKRQQQRRRQQQEQQQQQISQAVQFVEERVQQQLEQEVEEEEKLCIPERKFRHWQTLRQKQQRIKQPQQHQQQQHQSQQQQQKDKAAAAVERLRFHLVQQQRVPKQRGETETERKEDKRQQQQHTHEPHQTILSHAKRRTPVAATAPGGRLAFLRHLAASISLGCRTLLLLLLLCAMSPAAVHADWLMDCGDCHCKWNSGKKTADCKNLSLAAVPENLSSEVQVLDLSFNRIPYLEQNAFLNAQLHNLHKLYIRNSSLQQIDPRTFTQLEILIEVDLSNNLLRSLQPNVFARLVKVRALVLNGNQLEVLGDGVFQNLKYLHKVELKHNRLTRIGTQAFVNVPLLSQIYLDGNRLSFLRKESFEGVKRLTALSLDQNPWNCTCELQIFRDFVLKRNLYTPPTACYYPAHLRGMLWVEDQPEAFACKPRIIYPARGASINTSKENVTLVCRVHASPNTLIAWDYNKQMYRANSAFGGSSSSGSGSGSGGAAATTGGQQQRVHIQLLRDEQSKEKEFGRDVFISRLTILGAEKSDEGVYTCLAENAGGKDAVQMSLLVQKPGARDLLLQGNLIIVISLMALGLLSVSVFLAMVTCCIYKRFKAISPTHHRHHHHHLDVADQLTPGLEHTTTTVAGGTDVVLGVGGVDDTSVSNFKHHPQKTNANGGGGGEAAVRGKYSEVIKHGVTVMDNGLMGLGGGGSGVSGGGIGGQHADRAYLERNADDTLHIKYPHGPAQAEINRLLTATTLSGHGNDNSTGHGAGGGKGTSKWRADADGYDGELSGRGAGEYQPDLLPAYNNKANSGNQQGQLYSPIKATRTINLQEDHQQQPQQFVSAAKSKYNISAQEYLQSRYGTTATSTGGSRPNEKSTKREAPAIPLTTSASLPHSGGYAHIGVGAATATAVATESGFSTLQRHSKSLALPHALAHSRSNAPSAATSTDGGSYEYRQPPPPPYNAAHRTASSLLLQQRRTSTNDDGENNVTKDLGYRDAAVEAANARQTIVTASSSLNFLTTTGYTPQRQLL